MWEFIGYGIVASGFVLTGLAVLVSVTGLIIKAKNKIKKTLG